MGLKWLKGLAALRGPLKKVDFPKNNRNWVFIIRRCAETSSLRIYMVFLENRQILTELSMEIWAPLMFFETILRLFLVFLNQFLMGIQSTWAGLLVIIIPHRSYNLFLLYSTSEGLGRHRAGFLNFFCTGNKIYRSFIFISDFLVMNSSIFEKKFFFKQRKQISRIRLCHDLPLRPFYNLKYPGLLILIP